MAKKIATASENGRGEERGADNVNHLAEVRDSTKHFGYGTKQLLRVQERKEKFHTCFKDKMSNHHLLTSLPLH